MNINYQKTIAIYLGNTGEQPTKSHDTPEYTWKPKGGYLGFVLGPGAGTSSWEAPLNKYKDRLKDWPWKTIGAHLSLRIYNTFILPVLLFVAQLLPPSEEILKEERKTPGEILAGRRGWCKLEDLTHLSNLSAPAGLRYITRNTRAAMSRMAMWENSREGGIPR